MKIFIGIPTLDFAPAPHYAAMLNLTFNRAYDPKLRKDVPVVGQAILQNNIIPDARRQLVSSAHLAGATHIWFIDSDIVPPLGALNRLIAHRQEIVGASYRRRYPPHTILGNQDLATAPRKGLIAMATMGLGCMLIDLKVFEKLALPWFNYQLGVAGDKTKDISEDSWFCRNARNAGFTIWQDTSLTDEMGHVGMEIY